MIEVIGGEKIVDYHVSFISYLIGSIHGSKIAQFFSGVNIKKEGLKKFWCFKCSYCSWHAKYGILVAIIDILKGVIVVIGDSL